ncbi:LacI family DNA-binding transcriptional regulator [Methylobacterium sp. WSM2598]|uniref:LacI family DNA-binding transcriptional regulator n=1 Tax=Methylobacterium sp. WSM2598 TaxID=398261 RepID=UPI0009FFA6F1|nr:LacI family DNA-binding transcriptional regulator [Methylobacterium sp. WSM2598]
MRRPTIADVAKAANVSVSTVDRVLKRRHPVREETAELVQRAAEAVGYHLAQTVRRSGEQDRPVRTLGFLLQRRNEFYDTLGKLLQETTAASTTIRGRSMLKFRDYQEEEVVVERLVQLGRTCDAVAVVAADHPQLTEAIDILHEKGVPVFALISELTAPNRAGYIGLDYWMVGKTAAWFLSNMCRTPGKIAIYVGNHRFQSEIASEMSLRSYFREYARDFQLLESVVTLDEDDIAYKYTINLLRETQDLVGIYVAGGGINGVIRACREDPSTSSRNLVIIVMEGTQEAAKALLTGEIKVILAHPKKLLADTLVEAMAKSTIINQGAYYVHPRIQFDIRTQANWIPESELLKPYKPGLP